MNVLYIIGFILLVVGIVFVLQLTPDSIGKDIESFMNRKQSMREKALAARGKKKTNKVILWLEKIRRALEDTGKGKQFGVACAASLVLMIVGCVAAMALNNPFLAPVLAVALAMIPFLYLMRAVELYETQVKRELENALGNITASYERTRNLEIAVRENVERLKPPVRGIFESFLAETAVISPDLNRAIYHLKEKVRDGVFEQWCDALIRCQEDNHLIETLSPVVAKLTDIRLVNNELSVMISENKREYYVMLLMVVANIPLLYFLNKDWYSALMDTTLGKLVLAVCGIVILFTAFKMKKYTKPVEYKK